MVQPWKRIEPTIATKIDRRSVIIKTFEIPDTQELHVFGTFLSEGVRAGGVIALTADNQVIIAKEFRPGPEKIMYEIPGGGINPGEEPLVGAMRELLEETGYTSGEVTLLGTSCRDAYTNCTWYYYLARNCILSPGGQQLDEHEYVDVELISVGQFLDNAKHDKMTDPHAVLMAYDMLKTIQKGTEANATSH